MNAIKILIVILIIGSVSAGGYFVWENYLKQEETLINTQKNIESEKEKIAVSKKCEFPEKIGEFTKKEVSNLSIEEAEALEGLIGKTVAVYVGNYGFDQQSTFFFVYDDQSSVKENIDNDDFKECEIDGVEGFCKFENDLVGKSEVGLDSSELGYFVWREGKTVKMVMSFVSVLSFLDENNEASVNDSNVENVEKMEMFIAIMNKKTRENLASFVSSFKNCEIEFNSEN